MNAQTVRQSIAKRLDYLLTHHPAIYAQEWTNSTLKTYMALSNRELLHSVSAYSWREFGIMTLARLCDLTSELEFGYPGVNPDEITVKWLENMDRQQIAIGGYMNNTLQIVRKPFAYKAPKSNLAVSMIMSYCDLVKKPTRPSLAVSSRAHERWVRRHSSTKERGRIKYRALQDHKCYLVSVHRNMCENPHTTTANGLWDLTNELARVRVALNKIHKGNINH